MSYLLIFVTACITVVCLLYINAYYNLKRDYTETKSKLQEMCNDLQARWANTALRNATLSKQNDNLSYHNKLLADKCKSLRIKHLKNDRRNRK